MMTMVQALLNPIQARQPGVETGGQRVDPGLLPRAGESQLISQQSAASGSSSSPERSIWQRLGQVANTALPDALVFTNAALTARPNHKQFILANPLAGGYVHFISRPQTNFSLGGVSFNHIETIHYNTNGTGTFREDGFGTNWSVGQGSNKATFFINGRASDTNALFNDSNGVSVNGGFFGSPAAVRRFVDQIPDNAAGTRVKAALEAAIAAASASGTQVGLAWRGTLTYNRETQQVVLNLSGWKIPLADFEAAANSAAPDSLNYTNKSIARINNEEAYLRGENPFVQAQATREPLSNGQPGPFLNHGDPIAAIAGDVLWLQESVSADGRFPEAIRTNNAAGSLIEYLLVKSTWISQEQAEQWADLDGIEDIPVDPNPMTDEQRAKLEGLLLTMDRYGVYFGSSEVKAAAQQATSEARARGEAISGSPTQDEIAFVRNVFEGDFRQGYTDGYGVGDLVTDALLGLSRYGVILADLVSPQPTARDEDPLLQARAALEGFASRMALLPGGTLAALGLQASSPAEAPAQERAATEVLFRLMVQRIDNQGGEISGEAVYQQFAGLTENQRVAIGREVLARLSETGTNPSIDGVLIGTEPVSVGWIGGRNQQTGEALQGQLMWARSPEGNLVFWLQGVETNYVLRDVGGSLIQSQGDAIARARQMITNGAATDLRPLQDASPTPAPVSAQTNSPNIDGIEIRSEPATVQWVGGINQETGQSLQGELRWARTETGGLLFWLQGIQTNYVLRDADGGLVQSQGEAITRAREMITNGAATDLRPL